MAHSAGELARAHLDRLIVDVPDYPEPGVVFKDITPLLADHVAFGSVVGALAEHGRDASGATVVDKVVDARGSRKLAEDYLEFLYSPEGQEIVASYYNRPTDESVAEKHAKDFPEVRLVTVEDVFGGAEAVAHSKGYVVLKAVKQPRAHGEFEDDDEPAVHVKPRRADAVDGPKRRRA